MSLIVDLTTEEEAQLKLYTHAQDDAAAVSQAAREYIRLNRLRELKSVAGKLDFDDVSLQLESMELSDLRVFAIARQTFRSFHSTTNH